VSEDKKKLVLCSGPYAYKGFRTLDANPDFKPDYCAYLPPMPRELRDGTWDEIYLIHGIEHFHRWEAKELLSQIKEALVDGGLLVMEQPNLKVIAEVFLGLREPMTEPPELSGIDAIFGDSKYENPLMAHKWGWTPDSLTKCLIQCGFEKNQIKIGEALSRSFIKGRDFRVEATK
jgi:hypothetical protein